MQTSVMTTTLAGATFHQINLAQSYERTQGHVFQVHLKREPDNPYDKNAIAVHDLVNDDLLGYIPRDKQATWVPRIVSATGNPVDCLIDYWSAKQLYLAKIT